MGGKTTLAPTRRTSGHDLFYDQCIFAIAESMVSAILKE
jgi:hypothetical protein